VVNWPWHRRALSRGGNLYTQLLLGIEVRDATAGYRLFRRQALQAMHLERVQSLGYVFQVELVARALAAGMRVREVPIEFVERERGESKMTPDVARESLVRITRWGLAHRFRRRASV
jgi:dolichol-phosphate mannosyltransferase